MASPGTNLEGPRGLTEQGACGEHGEAGPVLSPSASPAPGPEAWKERAVLSDPVSSSSSDVLPVCVEGADEASERRREEGKPGHVPVLDAGRSAGRRRTLVRRARVLRPSEPALCLRTEA